MFKKFSSATEGEKKKRPPNGRWRKERKPAGVGAVSAPREAGEDSRPARTGARSGGRSEGARGGRSQGGGSYFQRRSGQSTGNRPKPSPNRDFRVPRKDFHKGDAPAGPEPIRSMIQKSRQEPVAPVTESTLHFSELNLPEELERALADAGFEHPTPIQEQSLPHTLGGFDLIGCAQTGTGKTAAFVLPMVTRLLEDEDSLALVLAPTRELAAQILDTLKKLTTHCRHIKHTLIIGGAPYNEQVRQMRAGPRVVVATPGRLVDHLQQKTINLAKVKFLVLDEADRMFDMGFAPQINKIVAQMPKDRQTLLFSATFNKEVKTLALKSLKNPKEVFVGAPSRAASGVEQEIIETAADKKFALLLDELNKREGTVLIFTGMKHRADRLSKNLEEYGHSVTRIHGGRSMGQRKNALNDFREQRVRILVATDIAARGLDIPHVAHVINFDLPKDPEDYIHRIGRTARAGAVGHALSFVTREEKENWQKISRLLAKNP
jgi:superfamily II DNA/RNA helicase